MFFAASAEPSAEPLSATGEVPRGNLLSRAKGVRLKGVMDWMQ